MSRAVCGLIMTEHLGGGDVIDRKNGNIYLRRKITKLRDSYFSFALVLSVESRIIQCALKPFIIFNAIRPIDTGQFYSAGKSR